MDYPIDLFRAKQVSTDKGSGGRAFRETSLCADQNVAQLPCSTTLHLALQPSTSQSTKKCTAVSPTSLRPLEVLALSKPAASSGQSALTWEIISQSEISIMERRHIGRMSFIILPIYLYIIAHCEKFA